MLIPRAIKFLFPMLVASCQQVYAQPQWTDLTPAKGARVYCVSSSTGSDSNPGTAAAPFRTLARGYAALADQSPDQLLLKCGDTWNESFGAWQKSSGDPAAKMVLASYGTGPRPKLRTTGGAIYGGQQNRAGLLIADLDLAPIAPVSAAGITFFAPWSYVTIEGCLIVGYSTNIVVQEVTPDRSVGWTIRNCVIVDSNEPGTGHSQGLFMGSCDGTVIEGNVFDLNASAKHDIFCHNVYLHQTCGPSTFRFNITARACSHGLQQRSGGWCEWNLALANPLGLFQGDGSAVFNTFRHNVALDSADISATNPRGFGFDLNAAFGAEVSDNIAAHQDHGTANCEGFNFDGAQLATVRNNIAYDWACPTVDWGHCFTGAVATFTGNRAFQPRGGECLWGASGATSYSGNTYGTTTPARAFNGGSWASWQAHEQMSVIVNPPVIDSRISAYMTTHGGGGLPEFMAEARKLERFSDRPEFRAWTVNTWVRNRFNCYADFDGDGHLSANDFQAFLNAFGAGNPAANCDGSTAGPAMNVNDFNCFLNAFAVGCS